MTSKEIKFSDLQRNDQKLADHNVRDEFKSLTVEERLEITQAHIRPFSIALMNITGDLNTGTMIRTAHLLGAKEVLVFGRNRIDNRSTVGAENYTKVSRLGGLREDLTVDEDLFVRELKSRNLIPMFIETGGARIDTLDVSTLLHPGEELCIVVGNEGRGIGENILDTRHHFDASILVEIPQVGVMRSLNVANAAAIAMWEVCRQMSWL